MYVSLQRRAQKCMTPAHDVRGNPRHTKITILPQFQSSDQHEVPRGLRVELKICVSPQFSKSDEHEVTKGLRDRRANSHFTTLLGFHTRCCTDASSSTSLLKSLVGLKIHTKGQTSTESNGNGNVVEIGSLHKLYCSVSEPMGQHSLPSNV